MHKRIYLDYAAAAPVTSRALRAFHSAVRSYGNPSSAHEHGRRAKTALEEARRAIAHWCGVKGDALVFTSGATEANAIAIRGHARALLRNGASPDNLHFLYVEGAHASVYETMRALQAEGIACDAVPLKEGDIDTEALKRLVRPETTLMSVEVVSSETGARFDIRAVRAVLDAARKDAQRIYLHADATQLPLVESYERTRLAADLVSLDAQKVGGVRGVGCLVISGAVPLAPVIDGGGQEGGLRSGTPSPALISAFATALTDAARTRDAFVARAAPLRAWLAERIVADIPHAYVNEGKQNAPHILNISFVGRDTDYLAALLDERGFSVSTKSACETNTREGSRGVQALTHDASRASSTIRLSWGPATKTSDAKRVLDALKECVSFIDQNVL